MLADSGNSNLYLGESRGWFWTERRPRGWGRCGPTPHIQACTEGPAESAAFLPASPLPHGQEASSQSTGVSQLTGLSLDACEGPEGIECSSGGSEEV